ncbi:hypothetical protein Nepgr_032834 [Nepenthes gracilis]|uniref:Uncharacterized protein n=1 Tax=Nepenthes gracilis TaxID=150966 RepID=A0AAD3Y8L1_NEPGR|nr:hypothetical protein Nepgr_032834 [Nepenthes gracilis]
MSWVFTKINEKASPPPLMNHPPILTQPPPPPNLQPVTFNLENKISPSVLLIIIVLAIIFFVSGLLHWLVRFLLRPTARELDDLENATALQGQLRENHRSICVRCLAPSTASGEGSQQQAIDEPRELPSSSAAASDADLKHEEPEIWVEVLNYHLWWISRLFAANVDSSFFMQQCK